MKEEYKILRLLYPPGILSQSKPLGHLTTCGGTEDEVCHVEPEGPLNVLDPVPEEIEGRPEVFGLFEGREALYAFDS
jgi:hypothetical protein